MITSKTFVVTGDTKTRNGQSVKDLGDNIDKTVNAYLAKNPGMKVEKITINAQITGTRDMALVNLLGEVKEGGKR